jgi:cytochrome P450
MQTKPAPPGPRHIPIVSTTIGLMAGIFGDPLSFFQGLARDYGDVCQFRMFGRPVVLLTNPDYIRGVLVDDNKNFVKSSFYDRLKLVLGTGLLTSEGEFHKRQRRLIQPAFHRKRIAAYGTAMTDSCATLAETWRDGKVVDVAQEMMRLTLTIISKTMFSRDTRGADDIGGAVSTLNSFVTNPLMGIAPNLALRLPLPVSRRARKAAQLLDATVFRIIEEHRASGRDTGDLLSMLLLAREENGETDQPGTLSPNGMANSGMNDAEVRDEVMTIFLAGHETTANALAWTWHLLSQHDAVEVQLQAELEDVLAGRIPTVDDLPRLTYARMVLDEVLRLYPPAWLIARKALNEYRVGRYAVRAGQDVMLSPYVMQHDPRYFADPFDFKPERWTDEFRASLPEFAYFPFGGGPRLCIGESFAKMEAVLLMATIAQKWKPRALPEHPVKPMPVVTLRPRYGLRMRFESRPSDNSVMRAASL